MRWASPISLAPYRSYSAASASASRPSIRATRARSVSGGLEVILFDRRESVNPWRDAPSSYHAILGNPIRRPPPYRSIEARVRHPRDTASRGQTKQSMLSRKEDSMKVFRPNKHRSGVGLSLGLALFAALLAMPAAASSHREAPGITRYPLWDNTDLYAFRDPIVTDQLTIIANWIPLEDPSGFPNFFHFDENAWYQIHIDNDGDGVEDITYRFIFTENVRNPNSFLQFLGPVTSLNDPNTNIYYTYTVDKIIGPAGNNVPAANITRIGSGLLELPNNVGPKTFSNGYNVQTLGAGVYTVDGSTRVFAGPRSDMFFVDLGWLG